MIFRSPSDRAGHQFGGHSLRHRPTAAPFSAAGGPPVYACVASVLAATSGPSAGGGAAFGSLKGPLLDPDYPVQPSKLMTEWTIRFAAAALARPMPQVSLPRDCH